MIIIIYDLDKENIPLGKYYKVYGKIVSGIPSSDGKYTCWRRDMYVFNLGPAKLNVRITGCIIIFGAQSIVERRPHDGAIN